MVPSLWARYIGELRGGSTTFIEKEWGFASYDFLPFALDSIYIDDLYVVPERRKEGLAMQLIAEIEEAGRKVSKQFILTVVKTETATCTESIKAQLHVGFMVVATDSGNIWLKREISKVGE